MSVRILNGDCRESLPTLDAGSVQCVVTSPPYFNLRDYHCENQIGVEETPDEYVAALVGVFREVRRVLRDDGTVWLNIGDSYAASGMRGNPAESEYRKQATNAGSLVPGRHPPPGSKPKDLLGIPWLVAFGLRADGWYIRSDIIWHKPAPMPESVRDRPTRAHEHVFLVSKRSAYFYNQVEARDDLQPSSVARLAQSSYDAQEGWKRANGGAKSNGKMKAVAAHFGGRNKSKINDQTRLASGNEWQQAPEAGANWRDVWPIASSGFRGAHFATFPPDLAMRCVRAGSRPGDVVLDPFGGAGTTALVADRLGRDAILIELNPEYCRMARERICADASLLAEVA